MVVVSGGSSLVSVTGLLIVGVSLGCGSWALEQAGFSSYKATGCLVVVHGFGSPAACGILVPRLGIELMFPALLGIFLTTGPPGKPPVTLLHQGLGSFL